MAGSALDHLRTFATVYRVGSITEASRLLGISQPAASAHISALEQSLGYLLFTRDRRGVSPTAKADELAREVGSHIDALDDVLSAGVIGAGMLHLAGPGELLQHLILPNLARFESPVTVSFGLADDLLERLRAGDVDLVVSAIRPRIAGLTATALYDEEFVLVASPVWKGRAVDDIPVVAYSDNLAIVRRYWRSVFDRRPATLRVAAIVPDLRGILVAIESGIGMSVLPTYLAAPALESGSLVVLNDPDVAPLNTVYLATRTGDLQRNARLRQLATTIELLASDF